MPAPDVDLSAEMPAPDVRPVVDVPPVVPRPPAAPPGPGGTRDFSGEQPTPVVDPATVQPYNPERDRENIRGELARRLVWLLVFAVGGVLLFVGMGLLDGTVMVQSVIPSLVALTGTALGFYFGTQSAAGRQQA